VSTFVPVNIYVTDNTPAANPLVGVQVSIFSQNGLTLITQALTNDVGMAAFLLASDFTYQVRFYQFQTNFQNPQYIEVEDPPVQNGFTAVGTPFVPPVSQDPRLCLCSGFFITVTGAPAPNTDIQFISKFDPLIMDGNGVLNERQIARTDQNGYVQVPLIRLGHYSVTIAGMEDVRRHIAVPDQPSVNLPDLIFPVVSQIVFDPVGPFTVTIGTDLPIGTTIVTSDGNEDSNYWDVLWSTDNIAVAAVLSGGPSIVLRGFVPGTCNLIAVNHQDPRSWHPEHPSANYGGRPLMYPYELHEATNIRALMLEIIRRAAYDWVIYRGNRRLAHRKVAQDAYIWLFVEAPGHPDWVEREKAGWSLFSFLALCAALDFDPDMVRASIKKLTPRRIQAMGRPPTRRKLPPPRPELDYIDTAALEDTHSLLIGGELPEFE
jgi:hypothetical protein